MISSLEVRRPACSFYSNSSTLPPLHRIEERCLTLPSSPYRAQSKELRFQFCNPEFPIQHTGKGYCLRFARAMACKPTNGEVTILHSGRSPACRLQARIDV